MDDGGIAFAKGGGGDSGGITIVQIPVFKEETVLHVKKTGQYSKIKMIAKPGKVAYSGKSRVLRYKVYMATHLATHRNNKHFIGLPLPILLGFQTTETEPSITASWKDSRIEGKNGV